MSSDGSDWHEVGCSREFDANTDRTTKVNNRLMVGCQVQDVGRRVERCSRKFEANTVRTTTVNHETNHLQLATLNPQPCTLNPQPCTYKFIS